MKQGASQIKKKMSEAIPSAVTKKYWSPTNIFKENQETHVNYRYGQAILLGLGLNNALHQMLPEVSAQQSTENHR